MTRDKLYKRFGPQLIEAIVLIIKDEINLVRNQLGLSERTNQQVINAIEDKLGTLSDYNWVGED